MITHNFKDHWVRGCRDIPWRGREVWRGRQLWETDRAEEIGKPRPDLGVVGCSIPAGLIVALPLSHQCDMGRVPACLVPAFPER